MQGRVQPSWSLDLPGGLGDAAQKKPTGNYGQHLSSRVIPFCVAIRVLPWCCNIFSGRGAFQACPQTCVVDKELIECNGCS